MPATEVRGVPRRVLAECCLRRSSPSELRLRGGGARLRPLPHVRLLEPRKRDEDEGPTDPARDIAGEARVAKDR